jgi:preprotein translocase subunit SecD
MAIDSSVLLFEKIREELKNGHSYLDAVQIAFRDGITVILDANITHFLVAMVLYYVGVGPLRGFAVSMLIGIFGTLLTGIVLLKKFLVYIAKNKSNQEIQI